MVNQDAKITVYRERMSEGEEREKDESLNHHRAFSFLKSVNLPRQYPHQRPFVGHVILFSARRGLLF